MGVNGDQILFLNFKTSIDFLIVELTLEINHILRDEVLKLEGLVAKILLELGEVLGQY